MTAVQITKDEFAEFRPSDMHDPEYVRETAWYRDGAVIGVVFHDRTSNSWAHLVFGPDKRGSYRPIGSQSCLPDEAMAARHCQDAVEEHAPAYTHVRRQ